MSPIGNWQNVLYSAGNEGTALEQLTKDKRFQNKCNFNEILMLDKWCLND